MAEQEVTITLSDGRVIVLREIDQRLVYEGLHDGPPTSERNDQLVAGIVEDASANGRHVVLIPPVQFELSGPSSLAPHGSRVLPRVAVRARFESDQAANGSGDYSELTILWFQEEWALPVALGVVEHIRDMDWANEARDMVW